MFPRLVASRSGLSIRLSAAVILTTILTACAVVRIDHVSVPAPLVANAIVPEFATARTWADEFSPAFLETAKLRLAQARQSENLRFSCTAPDRIHQNQRFGNRNVS